MPFLRVIRDKRGYETTYLMHWCRDGTRQRSRILYVFRTPGGIRVGREALESDILKQIEAQHPDIEFDWNAVFHNQQIVEASTELRRPRKRPSAEAPAEPHDYLAVQASPEFAHLRKTLRGFVFPMTVAFILWYALYVILSAYARGFMSTKVFGHINVALIFGLLQFVTTFLIAWLYARFANRKLDPLADKIRDEMQGGAS